MDDALNHYKQLSAIWSIMDDNDHEPAMTVAKIAIASLQS